MCIWVVLMVLPASVTHFPTPAFLSFSELARVLGNAQLDCEILAKLPDHLINTYSVHAACRTLLRVKAKVKVRWVKHSP